jgi:hypothetical protein
VRQMRGERGPRAAALVGALLWTVPSLQAYAQVVPKVGTCPTGYHSSGGACVPNSGELGARPALAKVGACPSGYHSSGDYCLASSDRAKHAIPRTGGCPSGYHSSGAYCLSNR